MAIKFLDEEQKSTIKFLDESAAPQASTQPAPTEDLTKPAFVAPRQRATELKKAQAAAISGRDEKDNELTWNDLTTNPSLQDIQKQFLQIRTGKKVEGVTGEELSKQFMSSARADEWNTFNNIAYLNQLRNSPLPDKEKLALGKLVFDRTKSALEEGGQPGARPYVEAVTSAFTDLTNYVGLGVGAGLKKVATKEATKAATRAALGQAAETGIKAKLAQAMTVTPLKAGLGVVGTEAVIGAGQAAVEQKSQVATSKVLAEQRPDLGLAPKEFDNTAVAVAALFSAAFGGVEAAGIMKAKGGKSGAEQLNDILKDKIKTPTDPNAPPTKVERVLTDPVAQNMDTVVEEFIKTEGRRILDEVNPATALTDAKIQKDMSARAVRVAMHVIEQDPTFRLRPGQQTSSAINEVFSNLDNVNDAVLEQAIRKEGLSPDDFAKANKMTVTEAAQVMQQYSAASKMLKRMTELDPAVKKQVDELFAKPDSQVSALGRIGQAIRFAERESKAFIVSGIGTTVRNVLGTSVGLTYNSAASLIEGAMYTVGRTLDGAAKGQRLTTAMRSLGDTMNDAFSVYGYMTKGGLSTEVTDTLLQHNPALRNNILSATQESSTTELSKVSQVFNTLNVAQDAFFRKAIFNASVEKHMRRAGLDMYQVIADGKTIPASILQQATDETLKATFSYTPKAQKQGIQTFEAGAEAAGNLFVKAAEFPGGSLLATFPRFMSNAIAFQYRYSIFGAMSGAEDLAQGALMKAAGSSGGDALIRKGQENIAKGVVGTAALAAAYDYRMNNQDVDAGSMKREDGSTVDMRAIFPIGPTLIIADFMAKQKLGVDVSFKDAQEAFLGLKIPGGTQNYLMDQVFNSFSSEKDADKFLIAVGKVIGDFTARFAQPFVFKSAYEFFDLFREEGAIQRDPNVITGDKDVIGIPVPAMLEAASNRVQGKLPVLKESLPEAVPRLREGPVYKEGEFFYSLVGVRETPAKTVAEKEIAKLAIDPYKLYGPSSGDREYDRTFVELANPAVVKTIEQMVKDKRYQEYSADEKAEKLTNAVRTATTQARNKTDGKFTSEDLSRIKKMEFNKLPERQRRIINSRYAKDNDGVTLEEAKDYRAIDKYRAMMADLEFAQGGLVPSFAKGGIVGKVLGKKAVGEASKTTLDALKKNKITTPNPIDDETISKIVDAELSKPTTSSAIDQTANMLMGKKPVLPKTTAKTTPSLPEAVATPSEAPVLSQTEQALPTPPAQVMEAPAPSKAFADEDYVKGEELMKEAFDEDYLTNWKIANPNDYANTLHSYTGQAIGVKYKDMPPPPFAAKVDDTIEYDMKGKEIKQGVYSAADEVDDQLIKFERVNGVEEGDLNKKFTTPKAINKLKHDDQVDVTEQRNNILMSIKQDRKDQFKQFRKSKDFDTFDDEALAVLQGDFRVKNGRELNLKTDREVVLNLAADYQKQLDDLRVKYKDTPPVKLYHGGMDVEGIKNKGFFDPQSTTKNFHQEMLAGAPSFTRDLNFNFSKDLYGGTTPSNFVYTEVPYADYMFTKVNMTPANYDVKDLNTIAQSINGSSYVARPVSLPRASYYEKEDMFPEANKLTVKDASSNIEKLVSRKPTGFGGRPNPKAVVTPDALKEATKQTEKFMDNAVNSSSGKEAYFAYNSIRDLMQKYASMGANVQTKGGIGQQYATKMNTFSDKYEKINKIANILESSGAKQRAETLKSFAELLQRYNDIGGDAAEEAARVKDLNAVFEFVPKLAKGGLASRR
jgi:hypothetical protein